MISRSTLVYFPGPHRHGSYLMGVGGVKSLPVSARYRAPSRFFPGANLIFGAEQIRRFRKRHQIGVSEA